jgi:hypothetical protein
MSPERVRDFGGDCYARPLIDATRHLSSRPHYRRRPGVGLKHVQDLAWHSGIVPTAGERTLSVPAGISSANVRSVVVLESEQLAANVGGAVAPVRCRDEYSPGTEFMHGHGACGALGAGYAACQRERRWGMNHAWEA